MDSNSVWNILSGISIGTIAAWAAAVSSIVAAICTATIKLYKAFTKYKSLKDENEEQKKMLMKHEETLAEINQALQKINTSLDEQKEVNLKQVRYTIAHTCDDALTKGEISAGKLRSLEEMYDEYVEIFHGNGYIKTLMTKTRSLPVNGQLDE